MNLAISDVFNIHGRGKILCIEDKSKGGIVIKIGYYLMLRTPNDKVANVKIIGIELAHYIDVSEYDKNRYKSNVLIEWDNQQLNDSEIIGSEIIEIRTCDGSQV